MSYKLRQHIAVIATDKSSVGVNREFNEYLQTTAALGRSDGTQGLPLGLPLEELSYEAHGLKPAPRQKDIRHLP